MTIPRIHRFTGIAYCVTTFALCCVTVPSKAQEPLPEVTEPAQDLAKELIGTWILVGTPGNVRTPPAKGGRLKFFTGAHWTMTQSNRKSGNVPFHHGGTYTLNQDEYVETIRYATSSTRRFIGRTYRFRIKIEGDTLTQIGLGNPWTEVWQRLR